VKINQVDIDSVFVFTGYKALYVKVSETHYALVNNLSQCLRMTWIKPVLFDITYEVLQCEVTVL